MHYWVLDLLGFGAEVAGRTNGGANDVCDSTSSEGGELHPVVVLGGGVGALGVSSGWWRRLLAGGLGALVWWAVVGGEVAGG